MCMPGVDEQLSDLKGVLAVARELGATMDLHSMLSQIERAARNVMECERASVFLYDAETDELYSYVATDSDEIRFSAKLGLAGATVQGRQIVNVADAYIDPRFNKEVDRQTGFRTRSVLSVPLLGLDDKVVGVLQVLNKADGHFRVWDEQLAATLAAQAGAAIQRQVLLDQYAMKRKLEHDLDVARSIQQELLPAEAPAIEGFDIAGWNKPADQTGGDAFDFMRLPDGKLAVTIADATGHGIGPALVIAECRALLRATAMSSDDPREIISRVNDLLVEDLPADRFVTCFFGLLDAGRSELAFGSAGHGPLFHYVARDDRVDQLQATGVPLGLMAGATYDEVAPLHFKPEDTLLLVTDGFFEWVGPDNTQFGTPRLEEILRQTRSGPAGEIIQELYRQVKAFGQGGQQADDLTAVVIKRV